MISRAKAIRAKCLDCCCGNAAEVRRCSVDNCPLFPFRMGRFCREDATWVQMDSLIGETAKEAIFDEETDEERE